MMLSLKVFYQRAVIPPFILVNISTGLAHIDGREQEQYMVPICSPIGIQLTDMTVVRFVID